ncbi:NAD(P)H-hydrate dehydratase [Rubrivirga sp.]|uniref:NAD(P)H-hydrate dehydratase n=1 Tax=Rubrivirga sp. TaxID=1885344 RepID=UPI003B5235C4
MTEPVLSADAMRAADRATIDDWGVPGRVLMETAGRAAAREIEARFPVRDRDVTVLVGTGNNGGDGLVVARVLAARGARVRTLVLPGDGTPDRTANLDLLRQLAEVAAGLDVVGFEDVRQVANAPADVVVDALLGIGITGALREPARSLCAWTNRVDAPVVALDVPSGLDATTGRAADDAVRAALTVAFGAVKSGLLLGDGPTLAGDVVVAEIGIPDAELDSHATAWRAAPGDVGRALPTRAADAHKYSAGRVLAVVGSRAFTGAAVLSATAAYRAGAGAVVAAVPESAADVVDARAPEVMVDAQPETDAGTLASASTAAILDRAASADAVLVGCGLGREPETLALVRELAASVEAPLVVDADGLSALADGADALARRRGPLVLTPHLGELRRLLGDRAFDPEDRIEAARELAVRWDAVLVFKGMPTVVGLPDGRVLVGPPGEPALATAGTGDTLAGSVVGLLAQGLAPGDAALCALHLGSTAAQLWAAEHGAGGLVASDLIARLPAAAHALRS